MKTMLRNSRFILCLIIFLLFKNFADGWHRHGRKRPFPERNSNKTFESNFLKSKMDFLESYERANGMHPLCNYPNFFGLIRMNYYADFYKKRCLNSALSESGPQNRGSAAPRSRTVRKARRPSKKKHALSPKKRKKITKLLQKSRCRPMKTMVPIVGPNPADELFPCKVLVNRCAGCCPSRVAECVPTKTKIRKFDVLRSSYFTNETIYKARVEEHVQCNCACKVKAADCGPGQIYEENSCLCMCPLKSRAPCDHRKKWSERDCKCICKKERDCSTGMVFNHDDCMCYQQHQYDEGFYEDLS